MVRTLITGIIAGIAGLWLTTKFIPGTRLEDLKTLLVAGTVLGIVITIVKPFASLVITSLLFFLGIAITLFFFK